MSNYIEGYTLRILRKGIKTNRKLKLEALLNNCVDDDEAILLERELEALKEGDKCMNTKEAIKWIFDIWHEWENVYGISGDISLTEGKKMDEVVELLKRGEKFEEKFLEIFNENKKVWQMWEECKKDIARASIENWKVSAERFVLEMKKLEQKYFPKPSDNFTVKVMGKINKKGEK